MNLFEDDMSEHFHVHEGPSLKNLQELMDYISMMEDRQFSHHLHGGKNDFGLWAEHIGASQDAVELMHSTKTRDELYTLLLGIRDGTHTPIADEQFTKDKENYAETNEKIADKFDDMATEMQEAIDNEFPDTLQDREDKLIERYEALKQKLSEHRRAGKDMLIPMLKIRVFRAKLAYAHASRESHDYNQVDEVLDEGEQEMVEALTIPEVNFKKDVEALASEGLKTNETKT